MGEALPSDTLPERSPDLFRTVLPFEHQKGPDTLLLRFKDFSTSPNTAHAYRMRARNDAGASAFSNEAGVTTLPAP